MFTKIQRIRLAILIPFFIGFTVVFVTNDRIVRLTDGRSNELSAEKMSGQSLTFAWRVGYERKVQTVFHNLRIQPKENASKRTSLDTVLPVEASEAKVADVLRKSNALEQIGNVKITPEMLQAEINRMSRETRQPEGLREIFAALDNNPHIIAEVVARPNLVERFAAELPEFTERWEREKNNFSNEIIETPFNYSPIEISLSPAFEDNTWKPMPLLPIGTYEHTAVWTGAEMLVWGGRKNDSSRTNAGSRYNPATDMWLPITGNNAPRPRRKHSAVWTGTEMIVWGGCGPASSFCGLGDGSRYNPATDSWNAVTMTNAPTPRLDHTAVWTGDRMIIWGGCTPNSNFSVCTNQPLGGMYFPATDTWVTVNAASFTRVRHTAVWTGTEMLVWGGYSNVGERFNPNTNSWTQMSAVNAPTNRDRHTAVWTGTEMIVWGGVTEVPLMLLNTGGRYNPATNTWTPTSLTNAPQARNLHTAVWTGTEMIVWGGASEVFSGALNSGSRYDPASDTWTATSQTNAPEARADHRAVWTGTEMIVWGDFEGPARTGGRYNPANDSWIPTGTNDPPVNNLDSKGIWTGAEMIVFGGTCCGTNVGGKFNPATAAWTPVSTLSEIGQRLAGFTLIWTGTEMIVWGGGNQFVYGDGARYNPANDTWTLISQINAPSARSRHSAVWTGSEMIIWGGETNNGKTNTGGRYNPSTNSWTPTSTADAPEPRYLHTAVIVGSQMIVWGGVGATDFLNTGGRYNFTTDSWQTVSSVNAPTKRYFHAAISTGTEMIIWGGRFTNVDSDSGLNTGGRYNPATDVWTPTSQTNAPSPRSRHSAVWTGIEMIIYAGNTPSFFQYLNDGGRYNPATDSWQAVSLFKIGTKRADHIAVWTGESMLVWGGQFNEGDSRAGYEYFANSGANPTKFDFDGDGMADISVFRPSDRVWYLLHSSLGFAAAQFGLSTDKIVPADFDGDGKTDLAVYRDGVWYLLNSSSGAVDIVSFGLASDIPVPADFTGDGRAELAVYRNGVWWTLDLNNNQSQTVQFGISSDKPVPADFDGDGKTDFAVYRGGVWFWLRSSDNGFAVVQFGLGSDRPVVADYDGDGKTDPAVYRDGVWYLLQSQSGFTAFQWGLATDIPSPADFDGDGKADAAVYRDGVWWQLRSQAGFQTLQFGLAGDKPIPAAFVP